MSDKIKYISVFSQNDFEKKCYKLGLNSFNVNEINADKAFIQIIGTPDSLKKYLEEDTIHYFNNCDADNVLNLEFDDITEETFKYNGVLFKGLTDEQAEQIVDFIEKHKGKDFYISCRAGRSRSVAVARYLLDMYGEEYGYFEKESTKKGNPILTPNIFVLTKLKRKFYEKNELFIDEDK